MADKVTAKTILRLSASEFQLLFENNQFKNDYHVHLKKFLNEKINFSAIANKKKKNPNLITFQVKCIQKIESGKCNKIASLSVKDHKIYEDFVEMDFLGSCTHLGETAMRVENPVKCTESEITIRGENTETESESESLNRKENELEKTESQKVDQESYFNAKTSEKEQEIDTVTVSAHDLENENYQEDLMAVENLLTINSTIEESPIDTYNETLKIFKLNNVEEIFESNENEQLTPPPYLENELKICPVNQQTDNANVEKKIGSPSDVRTKTLKRTAEREVIQDEKKYRKSSRIAAFTKMSTMKSKKGQK